MRSRHASSGWRVILVLAVAIVACAAICLSLVMLLGVPGRAVGSLGQPSPDLEPIEAGLLGVYLLVNQGSLDTAAGEPSAELLLQVQAGDTAAAIVSALQDGGVVADPMLLRYYLRYLGLDRTIDAGEYRIRGDMTPREMAALLQASSPAAIVLTIPEGWRKEEIARAVSASGLPISLDEFLANTRIRPSAYSFAGELPDPPDLEGFLFPDTYHLDPDAGASDVVQTMLDNFEQRVTTALRQGFGLQGLTLRQAVTLASIVEREAVWPDERPLIASVYLNRLATGMKLEADPTVQYAVAPGPDGTWWTRALTLDDLAFDSPYNTYIYPGLPPGPIANPGLASLEAVSAPASSPYFYFRASCDGSGRHVFAVTFEEHLANACP